MKTYLKTLVAFAVVVAFAAPARAQEISALRVQVVVSKYQGDKKVSSMPYTLSVNTDRHQAVLRMGAQVPIVTAVTPDAKSVTGIGPIQQVQYRDVGTSIDVASEPADSQGRYKLNINVDDSSVYTAEGQNAMRPGDHPSFRSFRATNSVLLKDGQSVQFTTATDKVSGEVVKVDVTVTVVK